MQQLFAGKPKLPVFLLTLYLWGVVTCQALSYDLPHTLWIAIASLPAAFLLSALALGLLDRLLYPASGRRRETRRALRPPVFAALVFFATLAALLLWFIHMQRYFSFGMDNALQLRQARGLEPYNDWHPVIHTLLFFTLPVKLGLEEHGIVLLQILYFSAAFAYLMLVLHDSGCPRFLLGLSLAFVVLDELIWVFLCSPFKDNAMMIFIMLLTAFTIRILCSGGAWLDAPLHLLLYAVCATLALKMRHNAVLYVAPSVLITLFSLVKKWRTRLLAAAAILLCLLALKGLYAALDVRSPDQRRVETLGLPLTIWCNVMQDAPEALPEDTQDILYRFATAEQYRTLYYPGSFNSIKFTGVVDVKAIDALGYGDALRITLQCFRCAPRQSWSALLKLTRMVWGVTDLYPNAENFGLLAQSGGLFETLKILFKGTANLLFGSLGLQMLVLLAVALALLRRRRIAFLYILPIFCHNFGTMLLLSGWDWRFFIYALPIFAPTLFLMLRDERTFPDTGGGKP